MDIGINKKDREKIADGLSHLLADSFTLYLKTHNFHWNVTGPMFNTLHLLFQAQYTELWNALDIIAERYHPSLWNIYAFHCSDGDNFGSDTPAAIATAKELCAVVNLFGYGEIKPRGAGYYGTSLLDTFKQIDADNFQTVLIERKEDVWPSFRAFLGKDRAQA